MRGVRRLVTAATVTGALAIGGIAFGAGSAHADPSVDTWHRLRMCESSNDYGINTGNGYYGAYQFDLSTWRSVGGAGYPNQASSTEQDYRALYLYRMRGWQPWECARILGLQEDSDARSHVPPPPPGTVSPPKGAAPPWPGKQFHVGDTSGYLKTWQKQMRKRGFPFSGTGYFGARTLKYVKVLQHDNGLCVCGFIGPKTWKAAWTGRK